MSTRFDSRNAETVCAHLGDDPAQHNGAVITPIYQNSLFVMETMDELVANYVPNQENTGPVGGMMRKFDYTRTANPTTEVAEKKIAFLEHGDLARCFSSGMAAISAAIMSTLHAGDHVVTVRSVYSPAHHFLTDYLQRYGISVGFAEGGSVADFERAVRPNTRLFYLESPSSFVMEQQDLEGIAALAKSRDIATICDNSWATPLYQRPLDFGVDLVVHSATKYLGGHSDIVAGVVVGKRERMLKLVREEGLLLGAVLDPFSGWLLTRGLRTLPVRLAQHAQNAATIAHRLFEHKSVARVYYPGMPDDKQPGLTAKQLSGRSGLLSFELKNTELTAAYKLVNSLKYYGIGYSWGGFESLALARRVSGEMFGVNEPDRVLIRLHIGLEHVEDLWHDLESALERN